MFEGFKSFTVCTQREPHNVSIAGISNSDVATSALPPLLLLHGFPQSRHIWHRVAPRIAGKFNVVIIDLRGYGDSSKPEHVSAYAKSDMARDCIAVMNSLGYTDSFFVCAHDRGARVAHKLCVHFPARVRKAIFLDICPTLTMYGNTNLEFAKAYFHWFFLIQKEPLPETLIANSPRQFAELFMGGRQAEGLTIFDPECFDYYARVLADPVAIHSMCQDYRASASLDLEEARDDIANRKLIQCPLQIFWGRSGIIGKCFDAVKEWQAVSSNDITVDGHGLDSGHYIPEHIPDVVASKILLFFCEP